MTFQTFKHRVLAVALFMTASICIFAQEPVSMNALISQSLNKINPSSPGSFLNCIAELKRIDAMFPDSIQPKYQTALQMKATCAPCEGSFIWYALYKTLPKTASVIIST